MRILNSFLFRQNFCLVCGLFIVLTTLHNTTIFSNAASDLGTQYIYHQHLGDEDTGDGCFTTPIYHEHTGTTAGDGCYTTPNKHHHTGNSSSKGGCYTNSLIHHHSGNSSLNGGCYTSAITHRHSGSSSSGGGCYSVANTHRHSGNSSSGGGCYSVTNTHRHTGNSSTNGGCYTVSNIHHHSGNSSSSGGCYTVPNIHHHTGNSTTGGGCYVFSYYMSVQVGCDGSAYCSSGPHGPDSSGQVYYVNNCPVCGATIQSYGSPAWGSCPNSKYEEVPVYVLGCGATEGQIMSYSLGCNLRDGQITGYNLGCGLKDGQITGYDLGCGLKDGQITSYSLGCNLNDGQITSYDLSCGLYDGQITGFGLSCGLTEGQITSYSLGCNKTEKTIIGYSLGCGMDEDNPIGSFNVSTSKEGWATVTNLDLVLSSPDVALSENPFSINETPVSSTYSIDENGEYEIILNTLPGFICEPLTITINSIDITPPEISTYHLTPSDWTNSEVIVSLEEYHDLQPDRTAGSGLSNTPFSYDGGKTWTDDISCSYTENGSYEILIQDALGNQSSKVFEITNIDAFEPTITKLSYDKTPDIESTTIVVEADDIMPDGQKGCGLHELPFSYDGGITWTDRDYFDVSENSDITLLVRDKLSNITQKQISINNILIPKITEDNKDSSEQDTSQNNSSPQSSSPAQPDTKPDKSTIDEPAKEDTQNPAIVPETDGLGTDSNNDNLLDDDNDDTLVDNTGNNNDYVESNDESNEDNTNNNDVSLERTTNTNTDNTIEETKPTSSPKEQNQVSDDVSNEIPKEEIYIPLEPTHEADNLEREINESTPTSDIIDQVKTLEEISDNSSTNSFTRMIFTLIFIIVAILILLLILFLLCRTVVISNLICKDDYKIKGIAFIHNNANSYEINISENLIDRCDTNKLKITFSRLFVITHRKSDINIYMPSKDGYIVKPDNHIFINIRH